MYLYTCSIRLSIHAVDAGWLASPLRPTEQLSIKVATRKASHRIVSYLSPEQSRQTPFSDEASFYTHLWRSLCHSSQILASSNRRRAFLLHQRRGLRSWGAACRTRHSRIRQEEGKQTFVNMRYVWHSAGVLFDSSPELLAVEGFECASAFLTREYFAARRRNNAAV